MVIKLCQPVFFSDITCHIKWWLIRDIKNICSVWDKTYVKLNLSSKVPRNFLGELFFLFFFQNESNQIITRISIAMITNRWNYRIYIKHFKEWSVFSLNRNDEWLSGTIPKSGLCIKMWPWKRDGKEKIWRWESE